MCRRDVVRAAVRRDGQPVRTVGFGWVETNCAFALDARAGRTKADQRDLVGGLGGDKNEVVTRGRLGERRGNECRGENAERLPHVTGLRARLGRIRMIHKPLWLSLT